MSHLRLLLPLVFIPFACGRGEIAEAVRPSREPGELALPPSANAPRVSRDAMAPDTFRPDSFDEFEVVDYDTLSPGGPLGDALVGLPGGPDPTVESLADSYRRYYGESLRAEGSAVRGRIDRELQRQAELRTAHERGFPDWIGMIEALTPEQRARLVSRLNAANVELARELHGSADEGGPAATGPAGAAPAEAAPIGPAASGAPPPGQ